MRKILLKIHLYGGLAGFWYLIILGTSSLNYNHHFEFMDGKKEPKDWSKIIAIDNGLENAPLAQTLRDSLGIIGWPLFWTFKRDSLSFEFNLEQPGKKLFHYLLIP
ncbi:MAG: hypothetical protein O2887_06410 [Bacteroidetes bacterium]|nr:hypothetical protein [Bacteroidota bacterium]MDA1120115.1 hypothetical protein [Bacteroidota bacterium]